MATLKNPVLPGFHPDPCMIRVGDDYFIATSTFEWWPGVSIHHSKDLVHWRLAARPLDRASQLSMQGVENSAGIWAPDLTWSDGLFWLIYTNVQESGMAWKDTPNYLVTAPSIEGPWSEPVYLNSSGFDPALLHDDDGRKWLVNMIWNGSGRVHRFQGTALQEYDGKAKALTGPIHNIFKGTAAQVTEGPRLYKQNGFYYLVTAEGGTGWNHQVTVARSKSITGPYEVHPENPVLTSKGDPTNPLQKAGHGSWVQAGDGSWWMAHLASRPFLTPFAPTHLDPLHRSRSILGRETALQPIVWGADGWPRLAHGGRFPKTEHPAPNLPPHPWPRVHDREDFNRDTWGPEFMTLREGPDESWISVKDRPGHLRLTGRQSLVSRFDQSLLARRVESPGVRGRTSVSFHPQDPRQAAGLIAYYSRTCFYYLKTTADEAGRVHLTVSVMDDGRHRETAEWDAPLIPGMPVHLEVEIMGPSLQFAYSADGDNWVRFGTPLDAGILSDEIGKGFTGAFIGMACQDMSGRGAKAWFDYFELTSVPFEKPYTGISGKS